MTNPRKWGGFLLAHHCPVPLEPAELWTGTGAAPMAAHTLAQPSHTAEPTAQGPCLLPWAPDTNHQTQMCPPPAPMRPELKDKHSTEPDAVKHPEAQKSMRRIFSTDNTIFVSLQLNGRARF